MTQVLITYLFHFESESDFELPFDVNISIRNFDRGLSKFVYDKEYILAIGDITLPFLQNEKLATRVFENVEGKHHSYLIHQQAALLQVFSLALWMVKDNCVTPMDTYWSDHNTKPLHVQRSTPEFIYSDSKGLYTKKYFNNIEISSAIEWMKTLEPLFMYNINGDYWDELKPPGIKRGFQGDPKLVSRFRRSLKFIILARSQPFLPAKIANYITAFEALITDEGSGDQVAERTALFLANNSTEKKDIYEKLKKAYNVRSTYIHGDVFTKYDNSFIAELTTTVDSILRTLFIELIKKYPEIDGFDSGKMKKWYRENMMFDFTRR